jgi:hypothetical protein
MRVAQLSWSGTAAWASAPGERTDSGLALTMTATAIAAAAGYARA